MTADGPFWDGVRGLMDNLTDMMVLADKSGKIIHINDAVEIITGHLASDLVGQNVAVLMPDELASSHQSFIDGFVSKTDTNRKEGLRRKNSFTVCKVVRPIKGQLKKKDGSIISVELIVSHISEEPRSLDYCLMAHIKDLTKHEMAERQQQDFLAGVAHELRTPLNGIIGLSDALIKTEQNKGRTKHLKMINSCGVRLVGLVNMIMDVSALRDGKMQLNLTKTVNCNEICEEVWELMNMAVDKNGKKIKKDSVDLQIECDPDLPLIEGDKERLSQVIFNLVNNALKFTPSGFVRIASAFEAEAGTLLLSVSDSGQGIKKENLGKIFEAFGQEEEGKGGGLGLGLAICTKVSELHGGKIWVESELGKGSQFYVRLPQRIADEVKMAGNAQEGGTKMGASTVFQTAQMENARMFKRQSSVPTKGLLAATTEADENSADAASDGDVEDEFGEVTLQEEAQRRLAEAGAITILSCDDVVKNHEVLEKVLDKDAGFEYKRSLDGYDCIETLESCALPDILLVSGGMTKQSIGGMTGYEVVNIVRREFQLSLPVIIVTNEVTNSGRMEALKHFANDVVLRDAEKEELSARIHSLVVRKLMDDINYERKVNREMMQRTLPRNVLESVKRSEGSLVANKFESVTFLYGMMKEFDIIQEIVPISQLCVLLNKMTTVFDIFLKPHDVFRVEMDGSGVLVVCGHDRQEDHVENILTYAKDVLEGLNQSNIKVAGKSVEFLMGVATG
ncbi:Nitrogen regulation protein NR, putative [Perkinsus marinus ATCC 50983]|uniref:histidine kinase n=1 Tax=Perkinsus marinus (strain ATCC 50983 / TXsc) TaxID=423536 RepID=C5LE34_PERM5|nr:Nitrogen regulation protein NR, putative [Perkinsus marinus ATCC 50983]EER05032.1 Nitrogen regulation protein NR, putative [Perkinsus marinus ATCC 50983]|eukprot:XP_002773216.1 Nitrogen regulation protein NR, putative [Perkinsus marinus ATCC 50983]